MRIVFFGTPELAVPTLAALHQHHQVTAAVCQPDKPRGRGKTPESPPVKRFAEEHRIPVVQPAKLNDGAFETWLRDQAPDLCALVAYGRLLKQPILDVPAHGFLNVHPSKLPAYRGPAPIQGALLDGLTETAVTIMQLDAGMDSGPILLQEPLPIDPDDNAGTLTEKAGELGAKLMLEAIALIEAGHAAFTPQNDADATYTKLLEKKDGRIDWSQTAARIHHLIRAATPWPGAQTQLNGKPIRILRSRVIDDTAGAPGEVVQADRSGLHVATGGGQLAILELQVAGKSPLGFVEFLNGARIAPGARFESLA
jgi:methionyl-tRNA formyltransferase